MSGSAIADVAGTGRISIDMMTGAGATRSATPLRSPRHPPLSDRHTTFDPDGALRARVRRIDRLSFSEELSCFLMCHLANGDQHIRRTGETFPSAANPTREWPPSPLSTARHPDAGNLLGASMEAS